MARRKTHSGLGVLAFNKESSMATKQIEVSKRVFDLDSKDFVDVKKVGEFSPAENAEQALAAVGGDANKFLEVINAGLEKFQTARLSEDAALPWMAEAEQDGKTILVPFTGKVLSEEKGKQLNVTVLNLAKTLFGYADADKIEDAEKRSAARAASKKSALDMILANPASVEALMK